MKDGQFGKTSNALSRSKMKYGKSPVRNPSSRLGASTRNLTEALASKSPVRVPSRMNKSISRSPISRVPDRSGRSPINVRKSTKEHVSPAPSSKHNPKQKSPRSPRSPAKTKNLDNGDVFFNALSLIVNQERKLEMSRRDLVSREDFIIKEIFNKIDKKGRGWFTIEDFRQFLNKIGVEDLDTRALIDLYSSFDSNQNCLLNFHELVNMVCPQSPKYAQYINKKRESSRYSVSFDPRYKI